MEDGVYGGRDLWDRLMKCVIGPESFLLRFFASCHEVNRFPAPCSSSMFLPFHGPKRNGAH